MVGDGGEDIVKMPNEPKRAAKPLFHMLPAVFHPVERGLNPSGSLQH
jgi:hypothetical protein